jgi:hypothetical protein
MKKNKSTLINDQIDIRNLIQNFWQYKILIFSISILSMLFVYNISLNDNKPNFFKSAISIEKISNLKQLKLSLDNHVSNLNPVLLTISSELSLKDSRSTSSNINPLLGLIFSFFLSLVIILFKKSFLITHN